MARCAREALADGSMGCYVRAEDYEDFISCGFSPALAPPFSAANIRTIRTSCGVFARAVLHNSGVWPSTRAGKVGDPLIGGWLQGLSFSHPAFVKAAGRNGPQPDPGDVFYLEYSLSGPGTSGHVGVFVERTPEGLWTTAEGGGSPSPTEAKGLTEAQILQTNGTMCRLSPAPKDIWGHLSLNRIMLGWFKADKLAEISRAAGHSAPLPAPEPAPSVELSPCKRGQKGAAVKAWQERLLALGFKLPRYGADGDYGGETQSATAALIKSIYDGSFVDDHVLDLAKGMK